MDLNDYRGQEVTIDLRNGESYTGVCKEYANCMDYRFTIGNAPHVYNASGSYTFTYGKEPYDIIFIQRCEIGLAQRHPHIDLSQFVGRRVYIRLNKECRSLQNEYIGTVSKFDDDTFEISGFQFTKSGHRCFYRQDQHITEIYDGNAFSIKTKEIPDTDPVVEKAKEAVKNLTEDQIAQLLHSLKK